MFKFRTGSVSLLLVALLAVVACAQAAAQDAPPATAPAAPLLVEGATGKRVTGLQWLLAGGKPSVYTGVRTLTRKDVDGVFGPNTAAAVVEMKRRLGWPDKALLPTAGRDLFDILTGKRARPVGYIARANERLAADEAINADRASTACAQRLIAFEREQLGIHEIPDGSNRGPRISYEAGGVGPYQGATGAYGLPWCASFQAYAYRVTHIGFPNAWNGYLADSEAGAAGVFNIVHSAQGRGWVRAIPAPAYLVAFVDGAGHIGLVERVTPDGVWSVEGNTSNMVGERFHPFGSRPMVFIQIPGCAGG